MQAHNLVTLVTLAALILFIVSAGRVGMARAKYKVAAPAVTGHETFERHFRVQMNTLEQLVVFLPALWLFAVYWNDVLAAAVGLAWIVVRVAYMAAYVQDPNKRSLYFTLSLAVTTFLIFGAASGAVRSMHGHRRLVI